MICPNCNTNIADGQAFCTNCGTRISAEAEHETAHPTSVPSAFKVPTDLSEPPCTPTAPVAPHAPVEPVYTAPPVPNAVTKAHAPVTPHEYISSIPTEEKTKKKSKKWIIISAISVFVIAAAVVAGFFTNWFGFAGSSAKDKNVTTNNDICSAYYAADNKVYYYNCETDTHILIAENFSEEFTADDYIYDAEDYSAFSADGNYIYCFENPSKEGCDLIRRSIKNPDEDPFEIETDVTNFKLFDDIGCLIYEKEDSFYEYVISTEETAEVDTDNFNDIEYFKDGRYVYSLSEEEDGRELYSVYTKTPGKDDNECIIENADDFTVMGEKIIYRRFTETQTIEISDCVDIDIDEDDEEYEDLIVEIEGAKLSYDLYNIYEYTDKEKLLKENVYVDTSYIDPVLYRVTNFDFEEKIPLSKVPANYNIQRFIETNAFVKSGKIREDSHDEIDMTAIPTGAVIKDQDSYYSYVVYMIYSDAKSETGDVYMASAKDGVLSKGELIAKDVSNAMLIGPKAVYGKNPKKAENGDMLYDWYYEDTLIAESTSGCMEITDKNNYWYLDGEGENLDYISLNGIKMNGTLVVCIDGEKSEFEVDGYCNVDELADGRWYVKASSAPQESDTEEEYEEDDEYEYDEEEKYELLIFEKGKFVSVAKDIIKMQPLYDSDESGFTDILYISDGTLYVLDGTKGKPIAENATSVKAIW